MKSIKRTIIRNALLIVAVVAFAVVLISSSEELNDTWILLGNVNIFEALLLPATQLVSYFFISNYYRSFLAAFGARISRWRAFGTTTALNFVNQVLPSGGASGTTYLIYAFKDKSPPGRLTLIQVGRYVLAFLSYVPLLLTAAVWLLVTDQLTPQLTLILGLLLAASLPGMVLLILALRQRKAVDKVVAFILRIINWVGRVIFRRKKPIVAIDSRYGFLKDFHDAIQFIHSQGSRVIKPYAFMQLSTLVEVSIVILAFWVLNVSVSPAIILVAFTAANIAGAISVVPGDIGVHELVVITVLSFIGVGAETAVAGTLLYRVFNKIVVMSIGFSFYVRYLKPLINNAKKTSNGSATGT